AAFGASWGALSQVVMEAAGTDRDQAAGLLPVVFSAGFGIGAAVMGLLANGLGFATAREADLQMVMLVLVAVAGGLAVVALGMAVALARRSD
ncbi:MAG: MFS transporter, partial [bacterium]